MTSYMRGYDRKERDMKKFIRGFICIILIVVACGNSNIYANAEESSKPKWYQLTKGETIGKVEQYDLYLFNCNPDKDEMVVSLKALGMISSEKNILPEYRVSNYYLDDYECYTRFVAKCSKCNHSEISTLPFSDLSTVICSMCKDEGHWSIKQQLVIKNEVGGDASPGSITLINGAKKKFVRLHYYPFAEDMIKVNGKSSNSGTKVTVPKGMSVTFSGTSSGYPFLTLKSSNEKVCKSSNDFKKKKIKFSTKGKSTLTFVNGNGDKIKCTVQVK